MSVDREIRAVEDHLDRFDLLGATRCLYMLCQSRFPSLLNQVIALKREAMGLHEMQIRKAMRQDDFETKRNDLVWRIEKFTDQLHTPAKAGEKTIAAFRQFDFGEQIAAFIPFRKQSNRLFLIHGEPNHGQPWLYNRLIRLKGCRIGEKPIRIALEGLHGSTVDDCISLLGTEIAPNVLDPTKFMVEICACIRQKLLNHDLIFIFERTRFDDSRLADFYQRVWLPILQAVPNDSEYQVVGFAVEYQQAEDLASAFASDNYPELVPLPQIQPVDGHVIDQWRDKCANEEHLWMLDLLDEKPELCRTLLEHAPFRSPWNFMKRMCNHINSEINLEEWLEH